MLYISHNPEGFLEVFFVLMRRKRAIVKLQVIPSADFGG